MDDPKYSVIIPCFNGLRYLPTCLKTILDQDYGSFEVIVSDDHSQDGTREYLESFSHPRVTFLTPPYPMSMAEHWEWAVAKARGMWLIFVGQDDGVQSYFFSMADQLTAMAQQMGLLSIMSKRALFYWEGCQGSYGSKAVSYSATPVVEVRNSKFHALLALAGKTTYLELPEMYTTSLFHRNLLEKARKIQDGKIFTTHPQDANLASICCSLERRYLYSFIPLGWVGTSPKSAGLAVTSALSSEQEELKEVYLQKTRDSLLKYAPQIGDFAVGSLALYFWGALLETGRLRSAFWNGILKSRSMTLLVLCAASREKVLSEKGSRAVLFDAVLRSNGVSRGQLSQFSVSRILLLVIDAIFLARGVLRRASGNALFPLSREQLRYTRNWVDSPETTMTGAGQAVHAELSELGWLLRLTLGKAATIGRVGSGRSGGSAARG